MVARVRKWLNDLPLETGKSLEEWLAILHRDGPSDRAERRKWLQTRHGFGPRVAEWLDGKAAGEREWDHDPDAYLRQASANIDAMYTGARAGLRPLHEALLAMALSLGSDVRVSPCKTIVPLYRKHVFAQIKPASAKRIDFGLALGKSTRRVPAWLIDTGGAAKNDRITHRAPIERLDQIDSRLATWTKIAYDLDG